MIYIVAVAWIDVRIRRMAMPVSFTFRFTSQIAEQIRTVAFKISWVKTRLTPKATACRCFAAGFLFVSTIRTNESCYIATKAQLLISVLEDLPLPIICVGLLGSTGGSLTGAATAFMIDVGLAFVSPEFRRRLRSRSDD